MELRLLPGTDLSVSRVCLGTMTFGGQTDESTAASMIDLSLDRGVNFLDTANVYAGGASEEIVGRLLASRRDKFVLASKVGIRVGDQPRQSGLSRAAILHQAEQSLARLRTDYLDIYYLHQPDRSTPLDESLGAMETLVREGKVRYVGASNYAAWQVCQMRCLAALRGLPPIAVTQPMYNLLARGIEQEFLPMCQSLGVATVVYNPLAGGLLTGKHLPDLPPAAGTRFDRMPAYQERYWHPQNFEAVSKLHQIARKDGRSLISLALGWLLHHTPVECVVVGASRLDQLDANLQAAEAGPCSEAVLEGCEAVWKSLRGVSPTYCR